VEGARLLENAIAFSSCVGRFEEVNQCPAGGRDRGDPAYLLAPRSRKSGSALYSPDKQRIACPCGDYSKKLSLVEHKSTA
jgi:hypothetical protein